MQGYPRNTSYFSQHPHQRTRKPVPRFDMNLKDLFSDDETDKRSFSRVSNQVNTMRPPPAPLKPEPMAFSADLKISPQLRTQGFSFQQQSQSQQQQGFAQQTPPTLSPPPISQSPPHPLPSPYQLSATLQSPSPYTYPQSSLSSSYPDLGFHNDLDFLDSFPVPGSSGNGTGGAVVDTQDVGIGFGMGFGDGTHDWSDGNGLDLFDGFFFGPGGTGM
jgi:hypothetical protein